MSTPFALRLPDSLAREVKRLAEENRVSMNQYVMMTLAEQVGRADALRFFRERAAHADAERTRLALASVPQAQPVRGDEMPDDLRERINERRRQRGSASQAKTRPVASRRPVVARARKA